MSGGNQGASVLLRLEERLRQERETFEQRKGQEAKWFNLRLRMGYMAALMLPAIGGIAGFIIMNESRFSSSVVAAAAAALLIDILGLLGAVWKIVLNPTGATPLEPITSRGPHPRHAEDVKPQSDD